ncbi:hypothetical protein [Bordetella sp. LUAb4]|uniref:hypothetical protein n=1 Tax=Bordetella sp. LUAb4 TaxID=2843195 RepID=UPI001E48A437|nr:hypothetical protein [Bordetella sp. LUAb4]
MQAFALATHLHRLFLGASELSQNEAPPTPTNWLGTAQYKQLFHNDVPAIQAKVGGERAVTFNSEAYFRILADRQTDTKIINAQTSSEPRVARIRADSGASDAGARSRADSGIHDGYVTADESPPASPTLSRKISSASSYWSIPESLAQSDEAQAMVEEQAVVGNVDGPVHADSLVHEEAVLSYDAGAEDDIAYADEDESTSMADDSHQLADQAPQPLPRLRRSLLPVPQQDVHWLLGRAPAPPVLQADDASAQSIQLAATLSASPAAPVPTSATVTTTAMAPGHPAAAAPLNPLHVFDFPKRAAPQPVPWYSGIGGFVMAQLNRLVDGFKAVRDMVYPAPAPASAYASTSSLSMSSEEIALTSLKIAREAAERCTTQARAADDMSAMQKLNFRTVTSQRDMFASNIYNQEVDAKGTAQESMQESKQVVRQLFQNTFSQAEQARFWEDMAVLAPFGNKLPSGLMEIASLAEPTDFAAYKKTVMDALDNFAANMDSLMQAQSASTVAPSHG